MGETPRTAARQLWTQLPFFVWLILLWMLLWGQFTMLSLLTGTVVAIVSTRVFRLPPVELSGRINLWYGLVFVVTFLGSVIVGSLQVAWQVWNGKPVGTAIIAVPLDTDDDLIMTHVGVTASLIPGSLVAQTDRKNRILYLHIIGVHGADDIERQRRGVLRWEDRIVRAVGSREQFLALKKREAAERKGVTS